MLLLKLNFKKYFVIGKLIVIQRFVINFFQTEAIFSYCKEYNEVIMFLIGVSLAAFSDIGHIQRHFPHATP